MWCWTEFESTQIMDDDVFARDVSAPGASSFVSILTKLTNLFYPTIMNNSSASIYHREHMRMWVMVGVNFEVNGSKVTEITSTEDRFSRPRAPVSVKDPYDRMVHLVPPDQNLKLRIGRRVVKKSCGS